MSTMINLGPMIAKVARDMLETQNSVIDVDSVYAKLIEVHGHAIFESERMLAQVAVRQKIRSHIKSAHSINGEDDADQLRLLKDDAPATLSVKQKDGNYAYIPLRMATIGDLDAVTAAKKKNIANVQASYKRWEKTVKPIRDLMAAENIGFIEAQKIIQEQPKPDKAPKRKKAS